MLHTSSPSPQNQAASSGAPGITGSCERSGNIDLESESASYLKLGSNALLWLFGWPITTVASRKKPEMELKVSIMRKL